MEPIMNADSYLAGAKTLPRSAPLLAWLTAILLCGLMARAGRAGNVLIDFEFNPSLPPGPSTFDPAANPETLTAVTAADTPLATITGGVVLGNPNFVASFPGTNGSAPNAYGTAFFAPNLSSTLTITFEPRVAVSEVTGAVFNGRGDVADYEVLGFQNNAEPVVEFLNNIPVNLDPASSATWDLKASAGSIITSVQVFEFSPGDGAYDFLIDNVGVTFQSVPEPSTWTLSAIGAGVVALYAGRRARRTQTEKRPG
jgi:hypothetical protein